MEATVLNRRQTVQGADMLWGPLLCAGGNSEHGNGEGGYPQHEKGVVSRDMFVEIAIVTSKEAVAIG